MQKAKDVARRMDEGLIIGCDTLAECSGQIFGKPKNQAHAGQMLRLLCGREHRVYSGLCIWRRPDDRVEVAVDVTTLVMKQVSEAELADYLAGEAWMGKAGAFGYQDRIGWLDIVAGSESNVVGLPLELLAAMLGSFAPG